MRLDKYLKVSRLIKRRSVANDACDGERVSVNGRQVKASYQVKVGDVIEIAFGQRTLKVEVTEVNEIANKSNAAAMYKEIGAGAIEYIGTAQRPSPTMVFDVHGVFYPLLVSPLRRPFRR